MMKKSIFVLLFILIVFLSLGEGITYLKLRAHDHPKFSRIVLEGEESAIAKGTVNQKGSNILVRFPHADLVLGSEKLSIPFRIDKNVIIFSPGVFSGFKVFTLKNPSRLVIDVYQKKEEKKKVSSLEAIRRRLREQKKRFIEPEIQKQIPRKREIKTVVIDPGHGGYEAGTIMENFKEKNVVLDIAKRLGSFISKGSKQTFLTRKSDQYMSLGERLKLANSKNPDVFLSIHIGKHSGIVLYTPIITEEVPYEERKFLANTGQKEYLPRTAALRDALRKAIIKDFGEDMVSEKPLPYSFLSDIEAAALLIELPSFEDAHYIEELNMELASTLYKGLSMYEENTSY